MKYREFDLTEAKKVFSYNKNTGLFLRNNHPTGGVSGDGYRTITFNGIRVLAHRFAWAYHYGEWPPHQIDHKNGDKKDNRIKNLRATTDYKNAKNQRKRSNNTSGVTGVYWASDRGKWCASIKVNYRQKHLGFFRRKSDAIAARKQAEKIHGFSTRHGT